MFISFKIPVKMLLGFLISCRKIKFKRYEKFRKKTSISFLFSIIRYTNYHFISKQREYKIVHV